MKRKNLAVEAMQRASKSNYILKGASSSSKKTTVKRKKTPKKVTPKPKKTEVKWRNDGKAPAFLRKPSSGKR